MNDLFGASPTHRVKSVPVKAKAPARNGTPGEADYTAASIEVRIDRTRVRPMSPAFAAP